MEKINKLGNKENGKQKKEDKLLCPKYDPVFQSLFSEKHKKQTGYLISAILGNKVKISDVFTEYSVLREYPEEKVGRLDFIATTDKGENVHIEIQLANNHNTFERLLYYSSEIISKQIVRGERYSDIKKTISILLANFEPDEIKGMGEMHTIWHLREDKNNEKVLTSLIEYHIINMKKAMEEYKKDSTNNLAQWLLFISNPNQKEMKTIMEINKELEETNDVLKELSEDDKLRIKAEIYERWAWEEESGKRSTLEYGRKEGREEGERNKAIEIARKMKSKGMSIESIMEITELTKEEIENL